MTPKAGAQDNPAKHLDMFRRRAAAGQCFHRPCMGVREFPAYFELVEDFPPTRLPEGARDCHLGWMLYDIDYGQDYAPQFFRAEMGGGVIDLERARREGMVK